MDILCLSSEKKQYIIFMNKYWKRYNKHIYNEEGKLADDRFLEKENGILVCKEDKEEVRTSQLKVEYHHLNTVSIRDMYFLDEVKDVYVWYQLNYFFSYLAWEEFPSRLESVVFHKSLYPGHGHTKSSVQVDSAVELRVFFILVAWEYKLRLHVSQEVKDAASSLLLEYYKYIETKAMVGLILHHKQHRKQISYGNFTLCPMSEFELAHQLNGDWKDVYDWLKKRHEQISKETKTIIRSSYVISSKWQHMTSLVGKRKCMLSKGIAYAVFDDFVNESVIWRPDAKEQGIFGKLLKDEYEETRETVKILFEVMDKKDFISSICNNAEYWVRRFMNINQVESEYRYRPNMISSINQPLVLQEMKSDTFPPCVNKILSRLKTTGHLAYEEKFFLSQFMSEVGFSITSYTGLVNSNYKNKTNIGYRSCQIKNLYRQKTIHAKNCSYPRKHGLCPFSDVTDWDIKLVGAIYNIGSETAGGLMDDSKTKGIKKTCAECASLTQSKKCGTRVQLKSEEVDPVSVHFYLNDIFEIQKAQPVISLIMEDDRTNQEWASSASSQNVILPPPPPSKFIINTRKVKPLPKIGRSWRASASNTDKLVAHHDTAGNDR